MTTEGSFLISVSRGHKDRAVEGLTHSLEKRQQKVNSQLPVFTEAPLINCTLLEQTIHLERVSK